MNRIGVISIGLNSIKVVLSEIQENGYFTIIDELKEIIPFDYDLSCHQSISKNNIDTALSILKSYKSLCTISGANKIISVMSNEFRKSSNSEEFFSKIRNVLDNPPCLLSDKDEAYYLYLSAINSIYIDDGLIINIRSTSTLIFELKNGKIYNLAILPYGSINLSYQYNLTDIISREDFDTATNIIKEELSKINWLKNASTKKVIAMGEAFKNFAKVDRFRKKYPLTNSNNYIMNNSDIHDLYNILKCKNLKLRNSIKGISKERAPIIVGSSIIANELLNALNIDNFMVCTRDLNQGILYDYLDTNFNKSEDILDSSIEGIMDTLNINKNHALHVLKISQKLFTELKPIHKLDDSYMNILKTSALLHDCGISVDYYNHHKHSFYIIINSYISGLSQRELLMSAFTAAYHRNNTFEPSIAQYSSIINKLDLNIIEKLGVLLKLAEGLDRSLEGAVKDIKVVIHEDSVQLILSSPLELDLEIRQVLRSADKFKEIYNKYLVVKKAE